MVGRSAKEGAWALHTAATWQAGDPPPPEWDIDDSDPLFLPRDASPRELSVLAALVLGSPVVLEEMAVELKPRWRPGRWREEPLYYVRPAT